MNNRNSFPILDATSARLRIAFSVFLFVVAVAGLIACFKLEAADTTMHLFMVVFVALTGMHLINTYRRLRR
ncbi:MAG: hypothetical protein WA001_02370 [Patescibacteria group bacterium]